jgi:magnesium transporter
METCLVFDKKSGLQTAIDLQTAVETTKDPRQVVWINLFQPAPEALEVLSQALNLHELTLQDLQNPKVRPKVEEFEDHILVVFKALNLNEGEDILDVINLNMLLFKNILITAHLKPLVSIREVLAEESKRPVCMQRGPAFVMYAILDRIVDEYFPLMDELDETTEDIQVRIFERFDPNVSSRIFEWKTRVAHLRRRVGPQREMLMNLANRPHPLIAPKIQVYYRDVYDHLIRIHDNLESYRDILQGAMDSYMTQVSNRMNEVMKVLSIVATIMLPLGILTGLYGTNFEVLPGSSGPFSFWVFVGSMLAVAVGATIFFKLRRWF